MRELLLESELNRQAFQVEYGRVRFRIEQYRRGYYWVHEAWRWAAPVAGFFLARRLAGGSFGKGLFGKGFFAQSSRWATLARAAWKIWETWRNRPSPSSGPAPF